MARRRPRTVARVLPQADHTLVDLVDNLLSRGVLLDGELILGLADVDLIYARLTLLLSAAERVLGAQAGPKRRRRR